MIFRETPRVWCCWPGDEEPALVKKPNLSRWPGEVSPSPRFLESMLGEDTCADSRSVRIVLPDAEVRGRVFFDDNGIASGLAVNEIGTGLYHLAGYDDRSPVLGPVVICLEKGTTDADAETVFRGALATGRSFLSLFA